MASWTAAGVGVEGIEPLLRFIEKHPTLDYGMPGPLVHFLEGFYETGYEERLVESVSRRPTVMTLWMLNRVLNGTNAPSKRRILVDAMREAVRHGEADAQLREVAQRFMERLNSNE